HMCIIIIAILASQSALGLYFIGLFLVYSFHCLSLHCKVRMFFTLMSFRMSSDPGLLRCPKNLKECIDWVLRATGKDNGTNNDNINNLNNALMAELPDFDDNSNDLTQLVQGLCLFMGYPSCLCKPKKSVKEGLGKIYEELKTSLISCSNSKLNCPSCSNGVPCKCCVIQSIKEVKGSCGCLKDPSNKASCHCAGKDVSCAQVLAGLEACLHLQCLQADMEDICQCNDPKNCCPGGKCNNTSSCEFCKTLQSSTPVPTTGLGLSPPNPIRLAKRLDTFFGDNGRKDPCACTCGSGPSCCCLACKDCSESCNSECRSQGSCLHTPKTPSDCPRQKFCLAIDGIKIAAQSKERTCCKGGEQCHCEVDGSGSGTKCTASSTSGSFKCCIERSGQNYKHSVKCMIRRVVKFFASFDSSDKCSKLCCELLCVRVHCWALGQIYNKGLKECKTCKPGGTGKCPGSKITPASTSCCNGNFDNCKSQNCCLGCNDCSAIKFRNAFETLKLSSPCGQDLYRVLDGFLYYCCNVLEPFINKKEVKEKINAAKGKCLQCSKKTSGTPCSCSDCDGCKALRGHNDIMSILRHGYFSSYDSSAKWDRLCSPGSKCCGSSSCSCTSGSCPSNCCEKCPKRLCAKIFLGMLPCLYYGLKIVFDRCQYGSDFPDWSLRKITEGSIGSFLFAWGYNVHPLISKKGFDIFPILGILYGSDKIFEKLYKFVSKKYFSHSLSSGSQNPLTVRSMLLWLYGLPFTSGFSSLVSRCKDLCSPFGNSFNSGAFCYYIHTCCSLLPVSVISTVQHSHSHVSTFFSTADSEWKSFSYPEDPFDLFNMLLENVRKVYIPLNFLYYQCDLDKDSAGWKDCAFGRQCAQKVLQSSSTSVSSASSGCSSCKHSGAYLCTAINKDPVHDHCAQEKCRGFGSTSTSCSGSSAHPQSQGKTCTPCPHPLQRFLIDDFSESPSSVSKSPFKLPSDSSVPPMGFKAEHLPSPGRRGYSIYDVIRYFCYSGFYPLTRLAEFPLCVTLQPPENFLELFGF
ncbi:hypothetical protein X943_001981, partial [Babesia divergens]